MGSQVNSRGQGCRGHQHSEWGRDATGFNKSTINLLPNFELLFVEHKHVGSDIDHRDHWLFRVKTVKDSRTKAQIVYQG